jgi:hypothetical protein
MLDSLVRERIVTQEAARLGLRASDAEVSDAIYKQFKDEKGQFVGMKRYAEFVDTQYGGVESFERGIRDSISAEKLKALGMIDEALGPRWPVREAGSFG